MGRVFLGSLAGPLLLHQTFLLRTLSCSSSDSTGWARPEWWSEGSWGGTHHGSYGPTTAPH